MANLENNRVKQIAEQKCRFVFSAPEDELECVLPHGFDKGIGWDPGTHYIVKDGGINRRLLVREG